MRKQKIGKTPHGLREARDTFPPVIVFGTERIGAIYALRKGLPRSSIRLATGGAEMARLLSGRESITVVRVDPEVWKPSTHPCELRTQETEQALKAFEKAGGLIKTVWMD
jgi:hypothetical protein